MDPNTSTLFHLVPVNGPAQAAFLHPDNNRFVSRSSARTPSLGLEVGYHVPSSPQGQVITRLGRDTDLVLPQSSPQDLMSAVHVAIEINPSTHLVVLSVRSKRASSVSLKIYNDKANGSQPAPSPGEPVTGDSVLLYGQDYEITIASLEFLLVWRTISSSDTENAESLKNLAVQGFQASSQLLQGVRTRDRPTGYDASEFRSWHITRLKTSKPRFEDIEELRQEIGRGAFGVVCKTVDRTSGHSFAVKVIRLQSYGNVDRARALIHREVSIMEKLKHQNIVEYMGRQHFETPHPEIFMPLYHGSLTSLAASPHLSISIERLCNEVLFQALCGLDYLASRNLVHRDIKPDNILYQDLGGGEYRFLLADFGIAQEQPMANTNCGTGFYKAPELYPAQSGVYAGQSHKMDVWSLFATIIHLMPRFSSFPPWSATGYTEVLSTLTDAAKEMPGINAMARLHPDNRASAAQMLVLLFNGEGLTTERSRITDIGPDTTPPRLALPPAAGPSNPRQAGQGRGGGSQIRAPALAPLIEYPSNRRGANADRGPSPRRPLLQGGANAGRRNAIVPSSPLGEADRPLLQPRPSILRVDGGGIGRRTTVSGAGNSIARRVTGQERRGSGGVAGRNANAHRLAEIAKAVAGRQLQPIKEEPQAEEMQVDELQAEELQAEEPPRTQPAPVGLTTRDVKVPGAFPRSSAGPS